jgi:CMP-N,N'-diacetyllegionaminic acid synthase
MTKKTCALIPARGGSKRIPRKNIADLNGNPLISYSIKAARQSDLIDEVWVSTDDQEIAFYASQCGAEILMRPSRLSEDTSTSESVLLHFAENNDFEFLIFIQPTSPLIRVSDIDHGIKLVQDGRYDSVLSVCEDYRFYWNDKCEPINYSPYLRPRSQDKETLYKETGSFYVTSRYFLEQSRCRISGHIGFVVVPELYSYEIDTYDDLKIVSAIMESIK